MIYLYGLFLLASPVWSMSPEEVRGKINDRIMQIDAPQPQVAKVIDKQLGVTPIRLYVPNKVGAVPIIMLIHGGAWVAGSIDTHDNLARYLCSNTDSVVLSVGYTLAPERKFPVQLEQCYDALLWAVEHAKEFSGDPKRLAVVGDSAGGNMAAALCLMARDRKGPKLLLQVLINPAPDLSADVDDFFEWQAQQYLAHTTDTKNSYVSPGVAENLKDLPPAYIILAEKDSLRPSGEAFAKRLLAAGNATVIFCQPDTDHLAGNAARASLHALPSLRAAVNALDKGFRENS